MSEPSDRDPSPPETAPLLSVIVPAHNIEPWIDETLASLCAQSLDAIEIVVVDDNSSDGTCDRVREWQRRDPRIRLERSARPGGGTARNTGVARSRGRYIAFCDGDDIVPPGAHAAMVTSLATSGSDMVVADYLKFSVDATWRPTETMPAYHDQRTGTSLRSSPSLLLSRPCWNKVFARTFWEREHLAFPDVARSNDIVPMVRAYLRAQQIDVLTDCVYLYRERLGTGSMTAAAVGLASLRSYLEQELICAQLIVADGDEAVCAMAAELFFLRDGIVHLRRYLEQPDDGSEADEDHASVGALVRQLAELLAPWRPTTDIVPTCLLEDVSAGRWGRARSLAVVSGRSLHANPVALWATWGELLDHLAADDRHSDALRDALWDQLGIALCMTVSNADTDAVVSWEGTVRRARAVWGDSVLREIPEFRSEPRGIASGVHVLEERVAYGARVERVVPAGGVIELLARTRGHGGCVPVLLSLAGRPSVLQPYRVEIRREESGSALIRARFASRMPSNVPFEVAFENEFARYVAPDVRTTRVPGVDPFSPFVVDRDHGMLRIVRRRPWILRHGARVARRLVDVVRNFR